MCCGHRTTESISPPGLLTPSRYEPLKKIWEWAIEGIETGVQGEQFGGSLLGRVFGKALDQWGKMEVRYDGLTQFGIGRGDSGAYPEYSYFLGPITNERVELTEDFFASGRLLLRLESSFASKIGF